MCVEWNKKIEPHLIMLLFLECTPDPLKKAFSRGENAILTVTIAPGNVNQGSGGDGIA